MTIAAMLLSPPPLPSEAAVDRPTQKHLRSLYLSLRRGELKGSTDVALATAKALRRVISGARFTILDELNNTIRMVGVWLQEARRGEQAITNVTLRTLHLVAEESRALLDQSAPMSRSGSLLLSPPTTSGYATPVRQSSILSNSGPPSASTSVAPTHSALNMSPMASPPVNTNPHRPQLYSRQDSNFFAHGSTFSISDLVTAGQNANNPAGGLGGMGSGDSGLSSGYTSGTSTPALGMGRGLGALGMTSAEGRDVGFSSFAPPSQQTATQARVDEEVSGDEEEPEHSEAESDDEDENDEEEDTLEAAQPGTSKELAVPQNAFHLKPLLIQVLQELIDEIETTRSNIARDARDHIHSGEIVLTIGHSATVDAFLKQAARDRTFTVIVADRGSSTAATLLSHSLPKSIRILSIPHSSIYTLLPRVTKVILSAHAVLANGGLLAPAGSSAATIAAMTQSTPVLVLAGLHKICGDWGWVGLAGGRTASGSIQGGGTGGSAGVRTMSSPLAGDVLTPPPQLFLPLSGQGKGRVSGLAEEAREVLLSEWDYVEPKGVDVLITNTGEYPGSYIYRLIGENFVE